MTLNGRNGEPCWVLIKGMHMRKLCSINSDYNYSPLLSITNIEMGPVYGHIRSPGVVFE